MRIKKNWKFAGLLMLSTALMPVPGYTSATLEISSQPLGNQYVDERTATNDVEITSTGDIKFNSSFKELWSYYSYVTNETGEVSFERIGDTVTYTPEQVQSAPQDYKGDIVFSSSGKFSDSDDAGIRIYKGLDVLEIGQSEIQTPGNIIIQAGTFNFTQKQGEILLRRSASGNFTINGGKFVVGEHGKALIGQKFYSDGGFGKTSTKLFINSGTLDIAAGGILQFSGYNVQYGGGSTNKVMITDSSAGILSFIGGNSESAKTIDIKDSIDLSQGELNLYSGNMILNADVTVKKFSFGDTTDVDATILGIKTPEGQILNVDKSHHLTVSEDFVMKSNSHLIGDGVLSLEHGASATFGILDFGTISVSGQNGSDVYGTITFMGAANLINLEAEGSKIQNNSNLTVENLTLKANGADKSELTLAKADEGGTAYLYIDHFDIEGGTVVFNQDSQLYIRKDAIINELTTINGKGTINFTSDPSKETGVLEFKDSVENSTKTISIAETINLVVGNGGTVDFNLSNGLTGFNLVSVEDGLLKVSQSENIIHKLVLGQAASSKSFVLQVAEGATLNFDKYAYIYPGAQLNIDGTLSINGTTDEGEYVVSGKSSTIAAAKGTETNVVGSGTLQLIGKITSNASYNIENLVIGDGTTTTVTHDTRGTSSSDWSSQHFAQNLTVNANAILNIDGGELDTAGLSGDGTIVINTNGILGVDSTSELTGVGSISGDGTLKLLNATNMTLLADSSSSLKVSIGTGTLTIGTDGSTSNTKFGSLSFNDSANGGSVVINDGSSLSLGSINVSGKSSLIGKGSLYLATAPADYGKISYISGGGNLDFNKIEITYGGLIVSRSGKIEDLTTIGLQVSGSGTLLNVNKITADGNSGGIGLTDGASLQVEKFMTSSTVVGTGTLVAGEGQFDSHAVSDFMGYAYPVLDTLDKSLSGILTVQGEINNVRVTQGTLEIEGTNHFYASELTKLGLTVQNIDVLSGELKNSSNGGEGLIVSNSGHFGNGTIGGLSKLTAANNDVRFTFDGTNTLVSYDMNNTNSVVQINQGGTLNLKDWSNETTDHKFIGAGTLSVQKDSGELKSTIENLGVLEINASSFTLSSQLNNLGELDLEQGGTTIASNGTVGTLVIDQSSTIVNGTLTITNKLDVQEDTSGTGTFIIQSGSADFGANFAGNLEIGSVANIKENISLGNVTFSSSNGGTLNIEEGKTLTLSSLTTSGRNVVNGAGVLAVSGSGSSFGAPINGLGKLDLKTSSSDATFNRSANISEISFAGGSSVTVNSGYTLTVSTLSGTGTPSVQGAGTFSFDGNTSESDLNVGSGLGTLNVISGKIKIVEDGTIGNVSLSMGNLAVADGKTLTVNNIDGAGELSAEGSYSAKLVLNNSANFVKNVSNFNTIMSTGRTVFQNGIDVTNLNIASGMTSINGTSNTIGTLTIDGTLDIGGYQKVNATNVTFNPGSSLNLNINPESLALGQIQSSNVTINPNVALNLNIGYGVKKDGMEFRVVDGGVPNGEFSVVSNNRYNLTNTNCSGGLCYKIVQTATGEEVVNQSGGSNNDAAVARAVLDSEIFKPTDRFYPVAVRLYDLSLYGSAKEYRDALTTVAPDVTGSAMKQSIDVQSQITNIAFSRLQRLGSNLGSRATNYGYKKAYGHAGGNYYKYRGNSRSSYRSSDLGDIKKYKRNNEYEYYRVKPTTVQKYDARKYNRYQDVTPTTGKVETSVAPNYQKYYGASSSDPKRYERFKNSYGVYENNERLDSTDPKKYSRSRDTILYQQEKTQTVLTPEKKYQRKILQPSSNGTVVADSMKYKHTGYQPFQNRLDFGVWAEGFFNTNEYKNENDPDGFSSDTTGFATGMDISFLDMFAFGVGYSNSQTDLKTLNRKTDVNGNTFFMYGMVKPNNFYVSGFLGFTSNEYKEHKKIKGIKEIEDNYDGSSVGAQINIGYDLGQWHPEVGVRYTNAKFDARTDSVGQKVDSYSGTVGTALANVTYETDLRRTDSDVVSADFSVGVSYDFKTAKQKNTVALENGSSYTVEGASLDKFGIEAGAGISYKANDHVEFRAEYDCDYKKDFISHSLKAHVRYNF
ncbi:MAG: autotransporter domain-containing protein [Alphaproteobacteria bacterium]|nr:autotransporter domain-containing protein [Alphaproteobacteria bacterium]